MPKKAKPATPVVESVEEGASQPNTKTPKPAKQTLEQMISICGDASEDLLATLASVKDEVDGIKKLKEELPHTITSCGQIMVKDVTGAIQEDLSDLSKSLRQVKQQVDKVRVWSFRHTCIMILLSLTLAFGGGIVGSFLMVKAHPDFFLEAIFKMSTNKFLDKLGQLYKKA